MGQPQRTDLEESWMAVLEKRPTRSCDYLEALPAGYCRERTGAPSTKRDSSKAKTSPRDTADVEMVDTTTAAAPETGSGPAAPPER